jgi:hypothetical protein
MGCLSLMAQLALLAFPHLTVYATDNTFALALIFPALYAVACGATMFAAEREDGTYEFLRGLPVTARQILIGKLTFAVASATLLFALLWLIARNLSHGILPESRTHLKLWGLFGVAAIEGLAWGMFFSLLLQRPLMAAVLAIFAASLGMHLVIWSIGPFGRGAYLELSRYLAAVPYRAVIAAVVLAIDVLLADRWLPTSRVARRGSFRRQTRLRAAAEVVDQMVPLPPVRGAVLGRLVWQTWRQSAWLMAVIAVVGTAALLLPYGEIVGIEGGFWRFVVAVVTASLMGSCVFLADQERSRFRFFVEQGVRPRSIWFARELTWFCAAAVWAFAVDTLRFGWSPIVLSLHLTILPYAAGQLASMFVRSGILAGFIGVVLTAMIFGWALLMRRLDVSWLWSVTPIPLVLLFATGLRAPDWIIERNTPRAWLRVGCALAVPAIALLIAVPLYRIYQIPAVSPGFVPEEYARSITSTPDERATAELYRRASESLVFSRTAESRKAEFNFNRTRPPDADDLKFLESNAESLAPLLEASQQSTCSFYDLPEGVRRPPRDPFGLGFLLDVSARQLESAGNLNEAWERYAAALRFAHRLRQNAGTGAHYTAQSIELQVYLELPLWAAEPGQNRQRIVAAIKQLKELEATLLSPSDAIKTDYLRLRRMVSGGPDALATSDIASSTVSKAALWSLMPWERARALRLLNFCTGNDLTFVERVQQSIENGSPVVLPSRWELTPRPRGLEPFNETNWLRTTFLLTAFYQPENTAGLGKDMVQMETRRRATRLLLALEAWKHDHDGQLPLSLKQLVGPYLDKLPLDPYSAMSFRYFRNGLVPPPKPPQMPAWQRSLLNFIRELFVPHDPFARRRRASAAAPVDAMADPFADAGPGPDPSVNAFDASVVGGEQPPNSGPNLAPDSPLLKPFIWSTGDRIRIDSPRPDDANELAENWPIDLKDVYIIDNAGAGRRPENDLDLWSSGWWFEIP